MERTHWAWLRRALAHPKLVAGVEAVLVAALGVAAAQIVLRWMEPVQVPIAPQAEPSSEAGPSAELLQAPLFGRAPAKPKPKAEPKPPQKLAPPVQAKLVGVILGSHPAAVIALQGKERVFFVGDEVAPGVRLARVAAREAWLDRGGVMQHLKLARAQALPAPPSPPLQANGARSGRVQKARVMPRRWVQRRLRDLPRLLTQARVVPHFKNGKADGFLITNIVPGSIYEQIGLQNGDIIKRVNGEAITTPQQAMAMYQALQTATEIELTIERAGQELQLRYQLQ